MAVQFHLTADEMSTLRREASARQARNRQAQSVDKILARGDPASVLFERDLMGLMGEYALLVKLFNLPYAEDYFVQDQWAKTHDFTINGVSGEIRTRTHAGYSFYSLTPQMRSDIGVVAYLVDGITDTGRVAFPGWLTKETFAEHRYVARERHPNWKGTGYLIGDKYLEPIESLWEYLHPNCLQEQPTSVVEEVRKVSKLSAALKRFLV